SDVRHRSRGTYEATFRAEDVLRFREPSQCCRSVQAVRRGIVDDQRAGGERAHIQKVGNVRRADDDSGVIVSAAIRVHVNLALVSTVAAQSGGEIREELSVAIRIAQMQL